VDFGSKLTVRLKRMKYKRQGFCKLKSAVFFILRSFCSLSLLKMIKQNNLHININSRFKQRALYHEAESNVSHHQTNTNQCTRLGSVPNLNLI